MFGAAKAFISGVNIPMMFYKFLAVAAVSLVVLTAVYREGLHDGESRVLAEQMSDIKTQITDERATLVKELDVRQQRMIGRIEEIHKDSQRADQLQKELDTIGDALDEIIKKRGSNPACAPSRGMLEQYRKLAEATRNPS